MYVYIYYYYYIKAFSTSQTELLVLLQVACQRSFCLSNMNDFTSTEEAKGRFNPGESPSGTPPQ